MRHGCNEENDSVHLPIIESKLANIFTFHTRLILKLQVSFYSSTRYRMTAIQTKVSCENAMDASLLFE